MAPIDAAAVWRTVERFEQMCGLLSRQRHEDRRDGVLEYATGYLGFTEDGLLALQEYLATDQELQQHIVDYGPVAEAMFLAGVLMGVAFATEAAEDETDVQAFLPEDFTPENFTGG